MLLDTILNQKKNETFGFSCVRFNSVAMHFCIDEKKSLKLLLYHVLSGSSETTFDPAPH